MNKVTKFVPKDPMKVNKEKREYLQATLWKDQIEYISAFRKALYG